ncbi:MAG: hypothetical protein RM021_000105 [Nostoc sp. EkiNYC01]|nr:hypothetical protein [Nostoc sp. EkiNYC01]
MGRFPRLARLAVARGHCGAYAENSKVSLTYLTSVDTEANIYKTKFMGLPTINKQIVS